MRSSEAATAEKPVTRETRSSKRPSVLIIAGGVVVFVLVALALGLGLGLGLKHRGLSSGSSPSPAATGPPLPGSGNGTAAREDWRLDTRQYVLDMNWDVNAAPTTRHYDFVITEGVGWPDGEFWRCELRLRC